MQNSLKWGVFCAAAGIVVGLISYLAGISLNPDFAWVRTIGFLGAAILLFLGVHEKYIEDPSNFTIGKGWVATFLISAISAVIIAVWVFVYASNIEPEIIDATLAQQKAALMAAKMTREEMDQALKGSAMFISAPGFAVSAFLGYLLGGMYFGAMLASIVKYVTSQGIALAIWIGFIVMNGVITTVIPLLMGGGLGSSVAILVALIVLYMASFFGISAYGKNNTPPSETVPV